MKNIFSILILTAAVLVTGCNTTTVTNSSTNPQVDNSDFSDYVPWWATNSLSNTNGVTNNVIIQTPQQN